MPTDPNLFPSSLFSSGLSQANAASSLVSNTTTVSAPVYIWFFGYIGNTFFPAHELELSQSAVIKVAQNLSETFGKQNLMLMTAVDEIPAKGGTITNDTSHISAVKSYVAKLHQYASGVYGRLDMSQFNLSPSGYGNCRIVAGQFRDYNCPIYNQTRLYINQLGLDGIWFDKAYYYYRIAGKLVFNQLMQNLTEMFGNSTRKFILNETCCGIITPLPGFTWESETYASPSPPQIYTFKLSSKKIGQLNAAFPGHVIAHLDAEGPPHLIGTSPREPMATFAALNVSAESKVLSMLVYKGLHAAQRDQSYAMVIPLIGSWTFNGKLNCSLQADFTVICSRKSPDYQGILYNALSSGKFALSTLKSFEQIVLENTPTMSIDPNNGPSGTRVVVNGSYFLHSKTVTIKFDGVAVNTTSSNNAGNFTASFVVTNYSRQSNYVSATDGINTLKAEFNETVS